MQWRIIGCSSYITDVLYRNITRIKTRCDFNLPIYFLNYPNLERVLFCIFYVCDIYRYLLGQQNRWWSQIWKNSLIPRFPLLEISERRLCGGISKWVFQSITDVRRIASWRMWIAKLHVARLRWMTGGSWNDDTRSQKPSWFNALAYTYLFSL